MKYAYHLTEAKLESIKRFGICSPYELFKKEPLEFEKISYKYYLDRTAKYLNKSKTKVTDEDILNFLDNSRLPCTSKCIFFSFIPLEQMPFVKKALDKRNLEFKIELKIIRSNSFGDPILVGPKRKIQQVSWKEFIDNYDNYIQEALNGANKDPECVLAYKWIKHFCVNCHPLFLNQMELLAERP